ncbi:MAG: nitrile hydratase accessory protein, partial [Gammaproteobacteria bacterium]|nr:nitrile hydratase accessory protein [Gammaproteobacteria bacterium]
ETLGAELRASAASAESDDVDGYYRAALRALERLVQTRGAIAAESIELRTEQWRRAYLATPHGQPVELSAGEV